MTDVVATHTHLQGTEAVQLRGTGMDNCQAGEQRLQRPCPSDPKVQRQVQAIQCSVHVARTSVRLHLQTVQRPSCLTT